jgi:hypothetical protein
MIHASVETITDSPQWLVDNLGPYLPFMTGMQMWAMGTVAAGVIWGVYLALCCGVGKIHCNDAFSAQRIPHYKNFLRFKIEPDKLTIYPIGLKRVPRRGAWRKVKTDSGLRIEPAKPLDPQLLEAPIEIVPADVKPIAV